MNGGPSHVDTFDPKPALDKYHGKPLPTDNLRTERKTGAALPSPFKFQKYGQSGHRGQRALRQDGRSTSTTCASSARCTPTCPNHEPSLMLMNCGDGRLPRPSIGVVGDLRPGQREPEPARLHRHVPRRLPDRQPRRTGGPRSCPASTRARTSTRSTRDVDKLIENIRNTDAAARPSSAGSSTCCAGSTSSTWTTAAARRAARSPHPVVRAGLPHADRSGRRLRHRAASRSDVRELYGDGVHGRQLLIARRLLERGVRFVQVWQRRRPAVGQPRQPREAAPQARRRVRPADRRVPRPTSSSAACSTARWCSGAASSAARRSPNCRSSTAATTTTTASPCWLAGGGVKGGHVHGATDEFGFAAVENKVHVHDLHATILHLLGFDHEKLTYRYAGRDFRLTDVHGRVVKEMLG